MENVKLFDTLNIRAGPCCAAPAPRRRHKAEWTTNTKHISNTKYNFMDIYKIQKNLTPYTPLQDLVALLPRLADATRLTRMGDEYQCASKAGSSQMHEKTQVEFLGVCMYVVCMCVCARERERE